MSFTRFGVTPARISQNQTRQRTAPSTSFGSHLAAGGASGANGVAAAHSTNVLRSFGLSPTGADQVLKGEPVTSKADQLAIQDAVRQAMSRPAEDKLGNFEIQRLMSAYNQAETLASNVLKKRDDSSNSAVQKIG